MHGCSERTNQTKDSLEKRSSSNIIYEVIGELQIDANAGTDVKFASFKLGLKRGEGNSPETDPDIYLC